MELGAVDEELGALAVLTVVDPVSFIPLTVLPRQSPLTVSQIVSEISLVNVALSEDELSLPVLLAIFI